MWKIYFTKHAQIDANKLKNAGLKKNAGALLGIIKNNPFQNSPPYEQLVGNLSHAFSRRINIQHRLIYHVYIKEKAVKIIRMWTHCD